MGGVVAEGDEVAAGLGRRVRRPGTERVGLAERTLLDAAVDLVRRDVQEPLDPDLAGDVAQHVGAEAVRAHERVAVLDRPIDVGLGREVDHRVVTGHRLPARRPGRRCRLDEAAATIVDDVADALQVAGVGERVVHRDLVVSGVEDVADVVAADEPGSTGDELLHVRIFQ